jgi:predicted transcriptional regulator
MAAQEKPYVSLGNQLKKVRQQAHRSLAEVSGAVEIDENQLKLIEAGLKRPDEDVMLLLISYFNMADQEAIHLWELAKYDSNLNDHVELTEVDSTEQVIQQLGSKPMVMLLTALDVRTMYSDGVEVSWNDAGITLNFTQTTNKNQSVSVSKVGMSHKQAESVIKVLQRAILSAKYSSSNKLLPPTTQDNK